MRTFADGMREDDRYRRKEVWHSKRPPSLNSTSETSADGQKWKITSPTYPTWSHIRRLMTVILTVDILIGFPQDVNCFAVNLPEVRREVGANEVVRRIFERSTVHRSQSSSLDLSQTQSRHRIRRQQDCFINLVFLLDHSGSINFENPHNWNTILNFTATLVSQLPVSPSAVNVGMVTFGDSASSAFFLNTYSTQQDVIRAILALPYTGGQTDTTEALHLMHFEQFTEANGARPRFRDVAVMITDGVATVNPGQAIPEAVSAQQDGITIFAVGIGKLVDATELAGISSPPHQLDRNYFLSPTFPALMTLVSELLGLFSCVVAPSTTTLAVTTPVTTPLRTGVSTATVITPAASSPTLGPSQTPSIATTSSSLLCQQQLVDLVFLLDHSGSINFANPNNWNLALNFTASLVSRFSIGLNGYQVGLVSFGDTAMNEFFLNQYESTQALVAAIMALPYRGGATDTTDALRLMHYDQFTAARGKRPRSPSVAIIITDGIPTVNVSDTLPEAQAAIADGISIIVVGIGNTADSPFDNKLDEAVLAALSSPPHTLNKNYFISPTFSALGTILVELASQTCPNARTSSTITTPVPTISLRTVTATTKASNLTFISTTPVTTASTTTTQTSTTTTTTAATTTTTTTTKPTTTSTTTTTTTPATTTTAQPTTTTKATSTSISSSPSILSTTTAPFIRLNCTLDLVFLLDHSGSINFASPKNWGIILNFTATIIQRIKIGPQAAQVGLVTFGDTAENAFFLNTFSDKNTLIRAVQTLPYLGGQTDTPDAISLMDNVQFTTANGMRPGSAKVAILLTDGKPTVNPEKTLPLAQAAEKNGVNLIVVGVGILVDVGAIAAVSSPPHIVNQNYFMSPSFTALNTIIGQLGQQLCAQVSDG